MVLMLYCHNRIRFVSLLAFAFLLAGSSSCSYRESRRAKAIARGRDLFEIHCSGCHGRRRLDLGIVPPDLHGIFDRKGLPSGRSATEGVVRSTILTGRSGIMPSYEGTLSDGDIQDIILYLHTLKAPAKTATPATDTPTTLRGGKSFFFPFRLFVPNANPVELARARAEMTPSRTAVDLFDAGDPVELDRWQVVSPGRSHTHYTR
jgi:mono/diheme cytochrome c family protein